MRYILIGIALAVLMPLPAGAFWWGPKKETIKQEWYGDQWPFTVKEGKLYCVSYKNVLFEAGGKIYALNGTARGKVNNKNAHNSPPGSERWRDLKEVWRVNPRSKQYVEIGGTVSYVNVGPFIKKGLELCD